MSITTYVDSEDGKSYFRVRVAKKSSLRTDLRLDRRVMKVSSMAEAQKIEKQLMKEIDRELIERERESISWGKIIEDWEMAVRGRDVFARPIGVSGLADYLSVLKHYTSEWNRYPIDQIDRAMAWRKLEEVERTISIRRRQILRAAIDNVFSYATLSGKVKVLSSPCEGYRSNKREEEKIPEILTLQEIKTLLRYAKEIDHPWYPVWTLALFTGMRSGELHALKWDAVDFENRMIMVHRNWTNKTGLGPTKGRYWRSVPMSDQLQSFLKELKISAGEREWVLPRFYQWDDGRQAEILRAFCIGAGIPSVKFHTLRACFGTQLIKDGVAPAVVMKVCGWKDLKTMQRYIRLSGIEVKGATDGLKLLPEAEVMGRVVELFQNEKA